jgi:hypothetical protein
VVHTLCQPAYRILCAIFNSGTSIAEQWFQEKEERKREKKRNEKGKLLDFGVPNTGSHTGFSFSSLFHFALLRQEIIDCLIKFCLYLHHHCI